MLTGEVQEGDARGETLDVAEVGCTDAAALPFAFIAAEDWTPLVISVPHVGLDWPDAYTPRPRVDFARNADYEVQSLYHRASELGAAMLVARYSRLLVDLNRADDDVSPNVVPDHPAPRPRRRPGTVAQAGDFAGSDHDRPGRGVVWSAAIGNVRLLHAPLEYAAFADRIARFHAPYYRALEILLQRRRARFGYAILLDAHSMPRTAGVDLVVGTLGGSSCAPQVEQLALETLRATDRRGNLRVRLNDPYLGGELVRRFGRPADGLHALQLEVSRSLYMDERTLALWGKAIGEHRRAGASLSHGAGPRAPSAPAALQNVESALGGPARAVDLRPGPPLEERPPCRGGAGTAKAIPRTAAAIPPSPAALSDFTELCERVTCFIRRLCESAPELHTPGTSAPHDRATSLTTCELATNSSAGPVSTSPIPCPKQSPEARIPAESREQR